MGGSSNRQPAPTVNSGNINQYKPAPVVNGKQPVGCGACKNYSELIK